MANRSKFPSQIDIFQEKYDLSPSQMVAVARFYELKNKLNKTPEEIEEYNNLYTELSPYKFDAEDWNLLADCITSLETFFKDNVEDYIETKQQEFNATLEKFSNKGLWSNTVTYQKWNTVSYNYETYLSKQDNNLNHVPVGDETDFWWQKVALRGQQGIPGIGLSWRGTYNNSMSYFVGDAVNYQNNIYYCINPSIGNLPTNTTYWQLFMSNSGIVFQSTEPISPYLNMVWISTSDQYNQIKFWDGTKWSCIGTCASHIVLYDNDNLIIADNVEDAFREFALALNNKVDNSTFNSHVTAFNNHLSDYVRQPGYAVSTGTVWQYDVTLNPAPTTYTDGMCIAIKMHADNGEGGCFINVNGLGNKRIVNHAGPINTAGKLKAGVIYSFRYDATTGNFILQGEGGEYGTAGAPQVLAGYTIGTENGIISGSMPNNGSQTATLKITGSGKPTKTIPAGYTTGGTITAELASSLASSILEGVTIGGVTGQLVPLNGERKLASGTATTGSAKTYTTNSGDTTTMYPVTVSGLTFKPSIILILTDIYFSAHYYSEYYNPAYNKPFVYVESYNFITVDGSNVYVNSTGFSIPCKAGSSRPVTWIAIE